MMIAQSDKQFVAIHLTNEWLETLPPTTGQVKLRATTKEEVILLFRSLKGGTKRKEAQPKKQQQQQKNKRDGFISRYQKNI